MCGRYTQTANLESLTSRFGLTDTSEMFGLRYNLAPGQQAPVLIKDAFLTASLMQWGLVPSWARNPSIGYKLINARAETLQEKPSFKKSLVDRRCLVLADGFYEWRKLGRDKIPMRFVLKSREPFAFAGLWDRWRKPGGGTLLSYTIITTEANEFIRSFHHRMPVILDRKNETSWLEPGLRDPARILSLLTPYPSKEMEGYDVSTLVNSPINNGPECIKRING